MLQETNSSGEATQSRNRFPAEYSRILIAEDHLLTRESLKRMLEHHGFEVTAVGDGTEARAVLEGENAPTIALLDWMLPGQSGVEVCQAIRELDGPRYTYIIVITGREATDDVITAFAAGADDFVRKPCDPIELLARIRSGQRIVKLENVLANRIIESEEALQKVHQLKRLVPICMYCKRVRDDSSYWQEIDEYIHRHTGTDFSHGICPNCMPE